MASYQYTYWNYVYLNIVSDETKYSEVFKSQTGLIDSLDALLVEWEMTIELEEIVLVANELGHSILQNQLIKLDVVLAPLCDLSDTHHTAYSEILNSSGSRASNLMILVGLFSTTCSNLISSFSFPDYDPIYVEKVASATFLSYTNHAKRLLIVDQHMWTTNSINYEFIV